MPRKTPITAAQEVGLRRPHGGDELGPGNEPTTENEAALRERLAMLSQASLRKTPWSRRTG